MHKKKSYKRPEIKAVNLVPEEAVLTGCKITMNASGGGTKCQEAGCVNRQAGS